MLVKFEHSQCYIGIFRKDIFVYSLITCSKHRRQKSATKLLRVLRKLAESKGVSLHLTAAPWADRSCKYRSLLLFYKKNGFTHLGYGRMVYTPKKCKGVLKNEDR